jgi:Acetyltransferase (GNAT) domain
MNWQIIETSNILWLETLQKIRYDIYHLPQYVDLEAKRIKATSEAILIADGDKVFFLPYLIRPCNNLFDNELIMPETFDVISPYGYPGILLSEAAVNTPEFVEIALKYLINVWRNQQVCSAFLRLHPLLKQNFNEMVQSGYYKVNGETVSVNLQLSETEIWHQTRPEHRNKINKCKRAGFTPTMVPFMQYINDFIAIYEQTMDRVGATKSYYFGSEYFLQLFKALGDQLHLCIVKLAEEIACAGLFTECCGIVQYHLGGTKNEFLPQAPSTLMFDYVRFWAKERGNQVFHLGGGVGGSQDSLYHFKAGFSKQRHTFLTQRLIIDQEKYLHLVELRAKYLKTDAETLLNTDFFPAYRSPNI